MCILPGTGESWIVVDSPRLFQMLFSALLLCTAVQVPQGIPLSRYVEDRRLDIDELLMLIVLNFCLLWGPLLHLRSVRGSLGQRLEKALSRLFPLQSSHWAPNLKIASIRQLLGSCRNFLSHCSSMLSDNIAQTVPQPYRMLYYAVLAQVWRA